MIPSGVLGKLKPTQEQIDDVNYGYWLAKESGKLDIGQSVVIKDKMIMAVEAIEGTDKCIRRGCKIARKNGRVIKVAKPAQDKRFDIPAIGMRTLKTMKKYVIILLLYIGVYFVPTFLLKGRVSSIVCEVYPPIQNRQWETDILRHSPTC